MLKIDKGIKIPPVGKGIGIREEIRETLPKMQIGDSFLIKDAKHTRDVRSKAQDVFAACRAQVSMRKVKDGVRVWKVGEKKRKYTKRSNGTTNGSGLIG